MSKLIGGRCLCGSITFTLSEGPLATRACWCRDCQYLCSGNASQSVFFRSAALDVSGETAEFVSASDAGNMIRRRFCPSCGTPLFSDAIAAPELLVVRLGALDDREAGQPASTIWTKSAPGWASIDCARPYFSGPPTDKIADHDADCFDPSSTTS